MKRHTFLDVLSVFILLCSFATAQAPGTSQPPAPVQQPPVTQAPPSSEQSPTRQQTEKQPQQLSTDHKITPAEAKELLESVDEIVQYVSKDSGFPIKHKVKRQLATREQVSKFLEDRLKKDKDAERLERSAVSLKKLGLLPRNFDLKPYLLALLKEQVAGFYDSETKTVYLLDWVEPEAQKPVLAHELTHALQDQNFDLTKWSEGPKNVKGDAEEAARDEMRSARQAVIEGQAMVVLLDYTLAPVGKSVSDSPQLVDAIKAGMLAGGTTPLYAQSPMFLKEALTFPYTFGLDFVRDVLSKRGRDGAFAGVMRAPPTETRQVMEPAAYLAREATPAVAVPEIDKLVGQDYERYDFGGLGQFDVWVILKQWVGDGAATQLSPKWRGGYYYVARKKGAPKDSVAPMLFTMRLADEQSAREFARLYGESVAKRYKSCSQIRPISPESPGEWQTEEGRVLVEVRGSTMSASESWDRDTADKLRGAALVSEKPVTAVKK